MLLSRPQLHSRKHNLTGVWGRVFQVAQMPENVFLQGYLVGVGLSMSFLNNPRQTRLRFFVNWQNELVLPPRVQSYKVEYTRGQLNLRWISNNGRKLNRRT